MGICKPIVTELSLIDVTRFYKSNQTLVAGVKSRTNILSFTYDLDLFPGICLEIKKYWLRHYKKWFFCIFIQNYILSAVYRMRISNKYISSYLRTTRNSITVYWFDGVEGLKLNCIEIKGKNPLSCYNIFNRSRSLAKYSKIKFSQINHHTNSKCSLVIWILMLTWIFKAPCYIRSPVVAIQFWDPFI